jgi:hypothetical protein
MIAPVAMVAMLRPIIAPASHGGSGRGGGPPASLLLCIIVNRLPCR